MPIFSSRRHPARLRAKRLCSTVPTARRPLLRRASFAGWGRASFPCAAGRTAGASMSAAARCIRQGCAAPCERAAPMPAFALTATPTASSPPTRRGKSWTATRSSASSPARCAHRANCQRGLAVGYGAHKYGRRARPRAGGDPPAARRTSAISTSRPKCAAAARRSGASSPGTSSSRSTPPPETVSLPPSSSPSCCAAKSCPLCACGAACCRRSTAASACTIKCACWAASGCMPPSRAKAPMSSGWSCALRERNRSCAVFAEGRLPAGAALRAAERVVSEILAGEA